MQRPGHTGRKALATKKKVAKAPQNRVKKASLKDKMFTWTKNASKSLPKFATAFSKRARSGTIVIQPRTMKLAKCPKIRIKVGGSDLGMS